MLKLLLYCRSTADGCLLNDPEHPTNICEPPISAKAEADRTVREAVEEAKTSRVRH